MRRVWKPVLPTIWSNGQLEKRCHLLVVLDGVSQRQLRSHAITVATTIAAVGEVSGGFHLGNDTQYRPFGDPHAVGNVPDTRIRLSGPFLGLFTIVFGNALGVWSEIMEFTVDKTLGQTTQSSLDDTMWDLIYDFVGSLLAAALGWLYVRHTRSAERRRLAEPLANLVGAWLQARRRRRAEPSESWPVRHEDRAGMRLSLGGSDPSRERA